SRLTPTFSGGGGRLNNEQRQTRNGRRRLLQRLVRQEVLLPRSLKAGMTPPAPHRSPRSPPPPPHPRIQALLFPSRSPAWARRWAAFSKSCVTTAASFAWLSCSIWALSSVKARLAAVGRFAISASDKLGTSGFVRQNCSRTFARKPSRVSPRFLSTCAATLFGSCSSPSNRCSVPTL